MSRTSVFRLATNESAGVIQVFVLIVTLFPIISNACSFGPAFRSSPFLISPRFQEEPQSPDPAVVQVSSIKRGYDDGNSASCSDAGIIELRVSTDQVGYDITLVSPEEHKHTIPDDLYGAVQENDDFFLRFIWLDGSKNYQEPLSIVLEVRSVSRAGQLGKAVEVRIDHPGGYSR